MWCSRTTYAGRETTVSLAQRTILALLVVALLILAVTGRSGVQALDATLSQRLLLAHFEGASAERDPGSGADATGRVGAPHCHDLQPSQSSTPPNMVASTLSVIVLNSDGGVPSPSMLSEPTALGVPRLSGRDVPPHDRPPRERTFIE